MQVPTLPRGCRVAPGPGGISSCSLGRRPLSRGTLCPLGSAGFPACLSTLGIAGFPTSLLQTPSPALALRLCLHSVKVGPEPSPWLQAPLGPSLVGVGTEFGMRHMVRPHVGDALVAPRQALEVGVAPVGGVPQPGLVPSLLFVLGQAVLERLEAELLSSLLVVLHHRTDLGVIRPPSDLASGLQTHRKQCILQALTLVSQHEVGCLLHAVRHLLIQGVGHGIELHHSLLAEAAVEETINDPSAALWAPGFLRCLTSVSTVNHLVAVLSSPAVARGGQHWSL